jgi:hypothetical protein
MVDMVGFWSVDNDFVGSPTQILGMYVHTLYVNIYVH